MNTIKSNPESNTGSIFDSLTFIGLDGSESFIQELNKIQLDQNLENCTIALAESAPERSKFQGLYEVLNILRINPDTKITLISFMSSQLFLSLKDMSDHKEAFELFQSYPHTRFKELPFAPQELNTLYAEETPIDYVNNHQIINQRKVELKNLVAVTHSKTDNLGSQRDQPEVWTLEQQKNVLYVVNWYKKNYPSTANCSDIEILQAIDEMRQQIELVAEGKHFEGVFCDIDGTLIIDNQINHGVIDLLEKYHKQGKEITIWTGGDLSEQQEKLETSGITKLLAEKDILYKLVSKYDYAGASVEIAIDDFDQNRLVVSNAIKSQIHIDPIRFVVKDSNEQINNLKNKLNN